MEYLKGAGSEVEFLVCTELLPSVRERYGPTFALLEIPEILRSNRSDRTIYFRHYGEQRYNDKWDERDGGSLLGTELSSEMVNSSKTSRQSTLTGSYPSTPLGKWYGSLRLIFRVGCYRSEIGKLMPLV